MPPRLFCLTLLVAWMQAPGNAWAAPAAAAGPSSAALAYEHHPRRLLVRLREGADWTAFSRESVAAGSRSKRMGRSARPGGRRRLDFARLELDPGQDMTRLMNRIARLPGVMYVEPDYRLRAHGLPDDPRLGEQWGLNNSGQAGGVADADIDAFEAWELSTGSPDVVIGVVDSGVNFEHPDIAPNLWVNPGEIPANGIDDDANGYVDDIHGINCIDPTREPFDEDGHGSHVAGIAAAARNNGEGVSGVAGRARIMALKFLQNDNGFTSDAVECLQYAVDMGVPITNNSWGGPAFSQALLDVIEAAGAAGQLVVAAAGNAGRDVDITPDYPGSYDAANIINVANTRTDDGLASSSNFGASQVDLGAPGTTILSVATPGAIPGNAAVVAAAVEYDARRMTASGHAAAAGPLAEGGLCDASGAWDGAIVVCERGVNTFREKADAAAAGGAVGVIVYNNVGGGINGTLEPGSASIPVVGISQADGQALLAGLATGASIVFRYDYETLSGTSMASPQVAGAAAVLLGADPGLDAVALKALLLDTVDPVPALAGKTVTGGRLNLYQALLALDLPAPMADPVPEQVPVSPAAAAAAGLGLIVIALRRRRPRVVRA